MTARTIPTLLLCLTLCSCGTLHNYQTAQPACLENAIAACRAAILFDDMESGLIHYAPKWGDGTAHVVIWVKGKDGVERIYDPSHRCYRTIDPDAVIFHKGRGLQLGTHATMLEHIMGKGMMP